MTAVIRIEEKATARLNYYADGGPQWNCDAGDNTFLENLIVGLLRTMTINARVNGIAQEGPAHPHPEAMLANYVVSQIPGAVLVSVDDPPGWPFVEGRVY